MKTFHALLSLALFSILGSACQQQNQGGGEFDPNWNQMGGAYDPATGMTSLPSRDEGISFYSSEVDRNMFQPVYFSFDDDRIMTSEQGKVQQVASYLRAGGARLIIAGHTCTIGTSEYNRVLGERRAHTVRNSLASMGVDPNLVQTISFGEDSPADPNALERNRRAEFGIYRPR